MNEFPRQNPWTSRGGSIYWIESHISSCILFLCLRNSLTELTHKWCTFSACHTNCELESWILIFVCSFAGRWHTVGYSQVCCLLPLRELLLDSHHTVTQSSRSFSLLSFLQRWDRTFTIFDPCSITRTSSSSNTPMTHTHNVKINGPSVTSMCFPVCPTHLLQYMQ